VVTIAIENAMLIEEQDNQFHSILAALAASIDAKDTMTSGHSIRVAELAVGIARELDFSESALDLLHVAAILHDYGKIGIDDAVLKKNGKLTTEEYSQMQLHSRMTQDILEKIHFAHKYRNVPCIAAAHHEYLDGSGYPWGLTAEEIPFMAKIITVADVFEALTADRHYRKTKSVDTAFAILDKGAGSKFDANLVAALKRHWESKGGMSQPRARIQDVGNGNSARACL
jgi:HD-GYP domain-containing protein (c-di-GMP phosphodiesterase class II)